MKIVSLFTPLLFALSLTGTVHAAVDVAAAVPIAHATIEAEKCPQDAAIKCLTADDSVAAADAADAVGADANADTHGALPKSATNPQVFDSAAMAVSEPETLAMLAVGLALLGFTARRRTNTDKFEN
jgi:hypothetical protein